jgi:hypothetical protein
MEHFKTIGIPNYWFEVAAIPEGGFIYFRHVRDICDVKLTNFSTFL